MINSIIVYLKHPIAITGIILTQVILSSVIIFINLPTPWAAIILFLIYAGGLIVLFIYITRLAANEKFNSSHKISKNLFKIIVITVIAYFVIKTSTEALTSNPLIIKSLSKVFRNSSITLVIALMCYLFFILIIISAIVETNYNTLRPSSVKYDKHS